LVSPPPPPLYGYPGWRWSSRYDHCRRPSRSPSRTIRFDGRSWRPLTSRHCNPWHVKDSRVFLKTLMTTPSQPEPRHNLSSRPAGTPTQLVFANGQALPTRMGMESHIWHRFRMLFASIKYHVTIAVVEEASTNGATCDFELIAKDGVYLPEIPRAIPAILLWPGSRADVAISCRCETCPCVAFLGHVDPANAGRRT
jgi:hypothetical protein